jgi:hypothetical protein
LVLTHTQDTIGEQAIAIDASQRGSVVNIGRANAPNGQISINNWIRGYSAINLYSGTTANGNQNVELGVTGTLETLSGDMILNPAGHAVIKGDLIARGQGADIIINAKDTLKLRGNLTAQNNIIVNAGTDIVAGQTSLYTHGTSALSQLNFRINRF